MAQRDEQAERIAKNLRDADLSTMSFTEMEDLFEDRDIAEFL